MAQINVSNLTFCYEGSYDNIFDKASFCVDTDWKLGLIGRNGKGKTTFLNLLLNKYKYQGSISSPAHFQYFPFDIPEQDMDKDTIDVIEGIYPDYELWKICRELELLKVNADVLYRPYRSLSHGERTKTMLCVLFSRENEFLLIDEPTNHLDMPARELIRDYLNGKKGFILVSHDRWLLDGCVDHVLVLERNQIRVEKGNFSTWWENRQRREHFEEMQNEKLKGEIRKLQESARRTALWAEKVEGRKIGFNPVEEHDRSKDTRAYIGEKSRRMQQRRKNLQRRQQEAIEEKADLLQNSERAVELKIKPADHYRQVYIKTKEMSLFYGEKEAVRKLDLEIRRGDRILLEGRNGCGKTTVIKAILTSENADVLDVLPEEVTDGNIRIQGELEMAKGLKISYISQDTSFLKGSLDDYIERTGADASLFRAILRQLDFERTQFEKPMQAYSEGQKKKVLIAASLLKEAHLYIWDEPMNYIDVFSRMQIENLILKYKPTMILVEHDCLFAEKCATQIVKL